MKINPGLLYLFLAFVLAGSSVVAAGYVSRSLEPFAVTTFSLLFGLLAALLIRARKIYQTLVSLNRQDWLTLFLQALFGIFLFRVFLTFGLHRTSAAEAGILVGAAPAITAILTRLFLGEPLSFRALGGVALTLIGVLILQGFPFKGASFSQAHLVGNLLVLAATFCESMLMVLARKTQDEKTATRKLDPIVQAGLVSAISLLLCLIPTLLEGSWPAARSMPVEGWLALAWYGGMATVAAYAFMFMGARSCDGYTIAAMSGVIPLASLILAIIFLDESVALRHWGGCFCIIAAIIVMAGKRWNTPS